MKKILSILLIILGTGCYFGSMYIENQVAAGKMKLQDAQKKLDQTDQLLSISPYSAPLGKGLKEASKGKIQEGQQQISYYTDLASNLKIASYLLIGLGFISSIFAFRKKKK